MPAVFWVAGSPSVGSFRRGHLALRLASTVRVAGTSRSAVVSVPFRPVQTSSPGHALLARPRSPPPPFALDRRSLRRTVEPALRFGQRLGPDALASTISAASVSGQVRGLHDPTVWEALWEALCPLLIPRASLAGKWRGAVLVHLLRVLRCASNSHHFPFFRCFF
ncbi:hypothetical protein BJV74DRAFT_810748 [Russula compacta]|nr:hypothetical protein BJV74DRAFT_810748 [Russula compacta]